MNKFPLVLLYMSLFSGCASNEWVKKNNQDTSLGFFSDASKCSQSAMKKQKFNVPTVPNAATAIEVPIGYDPNVYVDCLKHKGWPVPSADPTEYLELSTTCLQETQETKNLDENYVNGC